MKAAVIQKDFTLDIQDHPTPVPGPEEILIKVAYCGICGSDVHFLESKLMPPGTILGHEVSGHIVKTGNNVKNWKEGDKVVVLPFNPCMTCESCKKGDTHHCREGLVRSYGIGANPGAFSDYMLVHPPMLFKVPEGLDMKTASLTEPMAVSFHGINISGYKKGEPALVMGAGPIGLFCIYALKMAGAGDIFVSEPDSFRAEKAEAAGADKVFNPKQDNIRDDMVNLAGKPPGYIFECAGTASSMQEASGMVGQQGHIIMLGIHQGNVSIFPLLWFAKEIRVSFSFGYSKREFEDCLNLLGDNIVAHDVVVSSVLPLARINDGFNLLKEPGHSKILVDCQAV